MELFIEALLFFINSLSALTSISFSISSFIQLSKEFRSELNGYDYRLPGGKVFDTLEEYEKKGLFIFLEYTPGKVKTMLEEGGGEIENTVVTNKISRIVIDSITSFALLFEDELAKREAALALFNMIREWNCTSVLTLEEDPITEDKKTSSKSMEFESDSIILIYYIREKGKRKRFIEILKMRGTKHSKEVYQFNIEKKGLSINTEPFNDSKYL